MNPFVKPLISTVGVWNTFVQIRDESNSRLNVNYRPSYSRTLVSFPDFTVGEQERQAQYV